VIVSPEPLALVFLLGMRHGLDPDHVAMIDGLTMRAVNAGRPGAGWIGTWFSIGHSAAVAAVALLVAVFSQRLSAPPWLPNVIDWLVIVLLVLVGTLNLRGLLRASSDPRPSFPDRVLPPALRNAAGPLPTIMIGLLFGLVFDTASQAAAWGAVASTQAGFTGALAITAAFAVGMIMVDTIDSQIVARLASGEGGPRKAERWRRAAGWVIVGLSFGTALYALLGMAGITLGIADIAWTSAGLLAAVSVAALLQLARRYRQQP
jgi:high-affinity nickel-transport protein